jgi:hypothetical protein
MCDALFFFFLVLWSGHWTPVGVWTCACMYVHCIRRDMCVHVCVLYRDTCVNVCVRDVCACVCVT